MRIRIPHLLASTVALGLAGLALAQTNLGGQPANQVRRISQILGAQVVVDANANVGTVQDALLGDDNRVEYLVVSYDNKSVLVPFAAGTPDYDRRVIVYPVTREVFVSAPTFVGTAYPLTDRTYIDRVRTVFVARPRTPGERRDDRQDRRDDRRDDRHDDRHPGGNAPANPAPPKANPPATPPTNPPATPPVPPTPRPAVPPR